MAKFRGVVKKNALEGGFWELHAEDGKKYQLESDGKGLSEGGKVEIDGRLDKAAMSIGMTGPILRVQSVKKL